MDNFLHTNLCIRKPQAPVEAHHVEGGATQRPHAASSESLKVLALERAKRSHGIDQCSTFVEASRRSSSEMRGDVVVH